MSSCLSGSFFLWFSGRLGSFWGAPAVVSVVFVISAQRFNPSTHQLVDSTYQLFNSSTQFINSSTHRVIGNSLSLSPSVSFHSLSAGFVFGLSFLPLELQHAINADTFRLQSYLHNGPMLASCVQRLLAICVVFLIVAHVFLQSTQAWALRLCRTTAKADACYLNSPGLWPRACQIIGITSHQPSTHRLMY